MEVSNGKVLVTEILKKSLSPHWQEAKEEWELDHVYFVDDPQACLCGHFPILEVCVLRNKKNYEKVEVGNVCVKKFLGLPSNKIFNSLKKISKNQQKGINSDLASFAFQNGWINEWEKNFSLDTSKKRKLSEKQMQKRQEVNVKLVFNAKRRGVIHAPQKASLI